MGAVASHPHRGESAALVVVDLSDGGLRDGEPGSTDEFIDPVCPALIQGIIDSSKEELFRGELIVGLIGNQFFNGTSPTTSPKLCGTPEDSDLFYTLICNEPV